MGFVWWILQGKAMALFGYQYFQGAPGLTMFDQMIQCSLRSKYQGPLCWKRSSKIQEKTQKPTMNKDWDRKWHEAQLTLRCNFNWNILVQKQLLTNGKSMENIGKSTEIWLITCKSCPNYTEDHQSSPLWKKIHHQIMKIHHQFQIIQKIISQSSGWHVMAEWQFTS